MIITSDQELHTYREAGKISTEIMAQMRDAVKVGVLPSQIDALAGQLCEKYQVRPAFKGVQSGNLTYPANSCISVNDEILHGIPSTERALQANDLVKLDFGVIYKDVFTDHCITVGIGQLSPENERLLKTGREAVLRAVSQVHTGAQTGDLGFVMHKTAIRAGFDVLKQYIGHGIGRSLHEDPEIPAWGKKGRGEVLKSGMVVCVEAQVVAGSDEIYTDRNGWTIKLSDGKNGVMFEYLVVVTPNGPEILTDTVDWPLVV